MRVFTGAQMRDIDHRAQKDYGISGLQLMELAGLAVAETAWAMGAPGAAGDSPASPVRAWLRSWARAGNPRPAGSVRQITLVCGTGNNGGDGFVAARRLHGWGVPCRVFLVGDDSKVKGDALVNRRALSALGVSIEPAAPVALAAALSQSVVLVDALFGTGFHGDVPDGLRWIMECMNEAGIPVLAVDIPSGVNSGTGQAVSCAIKADITVTFAAPKLGQLFSPGADLCGDVLVADIGIPKALLADGDSTAVHVLGPADVAVCLPGRLADSHKGTYGHAGIVAGSVGFAGAAVMAAQACAVAGAGLTTVASPAGIQPTLAAKLTECMTLPVGPTGHPAFGAGDAGAVLEAAASWNAAGIGCGLGRTEETGAFVRAFARGLKIPFVLDADGLFALGTNAAEVLRPAAGRCVLTPHPGEMARLLGTDTAWVQSHRLEAAKKAADDSGNVCVLKGARTVIAEPFGSAYINLTGNAGQAKGGSGDILTGIIAALLAQGLSPLSAALTGVWMHGKAADLACEGRAQQTLLATECLNCLSGVYLLLEDYRQREETQWI